MKEVVITHAVRTAIGRIGGALHDKSELELASTVLSAIIKRSGIDPAIVNGVVMGHTKPGTQPMNIARCAWLSAGMPENVPAYTLYRACCSGTQSIFDACQMIQSDEADVMIAGGVDSLSNSCYSLRNVRGGIGNQNAIFIDALTENGQGQVPASVYGNLTQGTVAEFIAEHFNVTRAEQDKLSVLSHKRALKANADGVFCSQIVPIGNFKVDEHPRETTMEQLSRLKPSFKSDGTVTAGNSSGRNDGASCVLLMSAEMAHKLNFKRELRFVAAATTALDPHYLLMGPIDAVPKALKKAGLTLSDMDVIELNEAFASSTIATMRVLAEQSGESYESLLSRTNIHGSGISLGHPPGATGAILTTKLLYEMKRRSELNYGMVSMCVGGGHGFAAIWQRGGEE